jgi:type VI secretion system protein ImpJ
MSQINCNRVAWVDGMLIEVQHFQQMERSLEHQITMRSVLQSNHGWGFSRIELDEESLGLNRLGIRIAKGVFPDGTAFSIPDTDVFPKYLVIDSAQPGDVFCLAVSRAYLGTGEVGFGERADSARYKTETIEVADANVGIVEESAAQRVIMTTCALRTRLCTESQLRSDEVSLKIARLQGRHGASSAQLDARFIPPLLDARAHPSLDALCQELQGVLQMRLGTRVGPRFLSAGSGVAELLEILMVQAVSEYRLRLKHLDAYSPLPPSMLFIEMVGLLGRLSIVPSVEQEIEEADWKYDHDDLQGSFEGLGRALRRALALVIETPIVPLPFENQGDGFYRCVVDQQWKLQKMIFAFSADVPAELLRVKLPQQLKLGPVEKIQSLVDLQLPGARLQPVPVTPRHVPYYAQSVYFEVEATDPYWQQTMSSAAMALRVVGDFPNLKFEAWGLREGKIA